MLLHCIRHGQSTYNADGRIQGQSDVPLSELGTRQAEAVGDVLARLPVAAIYSSPLRRALETARLTAELLGLEVRTDRRLKEINAGVWEDRPRSEVERLFPQDIANWRSGDLDFTIPGGESRRDLLRRGMAAMQSIIRAGWGQVAVFAHGGLLVVTLKALLKIPRQEPPFDLENGSITTLAVDGDGRAELVSLDQVDHLRDVDSAGDGQG